MADDRYRDNDWRGDRSGGRGRGSSIFSDDDGDRWRGERGSSGGWNPEEKGWGRSSEGAGGRGFFERARSEVRSWLGDDDGESRDRGSERSRFGQGQSGFGGETYRSNQSGGSGGSFGGYGGSPSGQSHFDENYRRWRDQQIAQLDREYEDYCRERQQRFESDFGNWRQSRQGQSSASPSFGEAGSEASSSSRSALLGEQSAAETTTGGGDSSAMEASTGSGPETGTETGGRGRS